MQWTESLAWESKACVLVLTLMLHIFSKLHAIFGLQFSQQKNPPQLKLLLRFFHTQRNFFTGISAEEYEISMCL